MKLPVVLPEELNHSSHLKPSALSCPVESVGSIDGCWKKRETKQSFGAAFFCKNGAVGWYRVIASYDFKCMS